MRYTVVIEKGETSYSAYVPDLPGCVAVGETLEEVKQMIAEAIEFHLEGMLEDGLPIPKPTSIAHEVEVAKELFSSSTKIVNNFTQSIHCATVSHTVNKL